MRSWLPLTTVSLFVFCLVSVVRGFKCPEDYDQNCLFCNQEEECLYCKNGFYLNQTTLSTQQCYPCQEGCEKCFNPSYCTACKEEDGFFMDANICFRCSLGCKKCQDENTCDECYDSYMKYQAKCPLQKIQLYIIVGCLCILTGLLATCCLVSRRNKLEMDPNYTRLHGANPANGSFSKTKTYSFTVLDEEAKRDLSKVSDLDTIGRVSGSPETTQQRVRQGGPQFSHLSFIEPKTDASAITEDGKIKKKKVESFLEN